MGRRAGITAAETREALLAATLRVLTEQGVEGARISTIAREAGVTSAAIYTHFDSKAELVRAALDRHGRDAIGELLATADGGAALDVLRTIGRDLAAGGDDPAQPVLVQLVALAARDEQAATLVREGLEAPERAGADLVRAGQDAGEVDPTLGPEAVARFASLVVLGSLVADAVGLKPVDHQDWDAVVDRVVDALRPREGQP